MTTAYAPPTEPVQGDLAEQAFAKAGKRLIPFLFFLYVLAHIDRGNIGVVGGRHGCTCILDPQGSMPQCTMPKCQRAHLSIGH